MSTQYPNVIDSYPVHSDNVNEKVTSADVNNLQDAIVAIENRLNVAGLTALPAVGPADTFCVVSHVLYVSNGTAWIAASPIATATILGLVKVGANISVASDGTISIPSATTGSLGVVQVGSGLNVTNGVISVPPPGAQADFAPTGLTGATAPTRYVGGTTSGSPTSGTFQVGDFVIDQSGSVWICTTAGTPGTWKKIGSGYEFEVATLLGGNFEVTGKVTGTAAVAPSNTTMYATAGSGNTSGTYDPAFLQPTIQNVSSSVQYFFEATLYNEGSSSTTYAALWDLTANAIVANSTISSTYTQGGTVPPTIRTSSISLIAGHKYGLTGWVASGSYAGHITAARIVGVV